MIHETLTIWMALVALILIAAISRGVKKVRSGTSEKNTPGASNSPPPCEVLVPVAGADPTLQESLATLLTQSRPNYGVLFIVESEHDPAYSTVAGLVATAANARIVLSGPSKGCGQKNHNLIAGIRSLRHETEIVVFCDAANRANPGWLHHFTRPLESDPDRVLTTFRDFFPIPPTLGAVCQAIYGAFLLVLPRMRPSPWGGATAMHRRLLEKLCVTEAWSRTVVDDVVLGRLLYENKVPMTLDRSNRLDTPLRSHSLRSFLAYLERQVLFPKFADPFIWFATMAFHLNLAMATLWAFFSCFALFPLHLIDSWAGWTALGFLLFEIAASLLLRSTNPHRISAGRWLLAFYPCIFLGAYVFLRSIFLREIVWKGRRYLVGRKGIVLSIRNE